MPREGGAQRRDLSSGTSLVRAWVPDRRPAQGRAYVREDKWGAHACAFLRANERPDEGRSRERPSGDSCLARLAPRAPHPGPLTGRGEGARFSSPCNGEGDRPKPAGRRRVEGPRPSGRGMSATRSTPPAAAPHRPCSARPLPQLALGKKGGGGRLVHAQPEEIRTPPFCPRCAGEAVLPKAKPKGASRLSPVLRTPAAGLRPGPPPLAGAEISLGYPPPSGLGLFFLCLITTRGPVWSAGGGGGVERVLRAG